MDDIVNIYTQAFQLLDPKMLYNTVFLFLVKHTGSVKRIFEKYKNIEYSALYYTFKSKYHVLHKIFCTDIFMYIRIKNINQLEDVLKDCRVKLKNDFNTQALNIGTYVALSIERDNDIYQEYKEILNTVSMKNSLMIIIKNNDIIWNTSNIMIEAMSERNKFLINEWNTKKSMIDIELFKKEFMQLLTIMFTVMRKTVP